ncbi:MAG: hypothetical protein BWY73_00795 [candidate division TA06 bacterium ADurb.Bin417]|uniref:NAD-specific glutamate dehydrogenase n=1 Tax=candidate division TA06 bacterium ADurb.Bin417 TaxID=1852828 RepID=A0A1V5MGW7_UNCT6|nr:MAG: hypothetical protein BWY73_00795 [candidate division TA06 bacterium ADurb.Bin417]
MAAVGVQRDPLDVPGGREGHHHVLGFDQVQLVHLGGLGQDFGPPLVAVFPGQFLQLGPDDLVDQLRVGQDFVVVGDVLLQFVAFLVDLVLLQAGQAGQRHGQHRVGLPLGELELLLEAGPGVGNRLARLDELNHRFDVGQGDQVALQDVEAFLGLAQVVAGAPGDDLAPVGQEDAEHLRQGHHHRFALDQGQVDDAVGGSQLAVLVKLVEHQFRALAGLELDDHPDAFLVRLVPDGGDAVHQVAVAQLGDFGDQVGLVDFVRKLGDDDGFAVVAELLDLGPGLDGDQAVAGSVGLLDALLAEDVAARREVGAGQDGHDFLDGRLGILDHQVQGCHHLAQVVGRDIGGHADRDAGGAVDQQVGKLAGQDRGLEQGLVEVGGPGDGLLLDIGQQFRGDRFQAGLGVAHGRGRVAVDGAEVALAVHQRVTQGEGLGHAAEGVVDGRVAVRMVLTHHLADDTGALLVGAVAVQPQLLHGVKDAPVDGLEAVAGVRQRPADDDAHRVIDVGALHLRFELDRAYLFFDLFRFGHFLSSD